MRSPAALLLAALLLAPAPALAADAAPANAPEAARPQAATAPDRTQDRDRDLEREHERFEQFARQQVERMNATIIGGRRSMRVRKEADGLYHASYKAIDLGGLVCRVRRSESDPSYFVGDLVYKERILESVGRTAEACRKGAFEPVAETANRVIYSSKRGGGWY